MTEQKEQQINIELGEKEAEGIYSNLAIITHSTAEFVIDFTRLLPGVPKAKVYSRIIMTPQHAKLLLGALKDNISKYEGSFGEIKTIPNDPSAQQFGYPLSGKEGKIN
ncbi:MAG: DUF3467 domain-containing protein [Bacteroidetes bacterium]|nr:DUF3467 domain-containing protein [Bacteroidota bacterium]